MDLALTKPDELVRLAGGRLRAERLAQQLTQAEVAARAGVGISTLSKLESGRSVAFEAVVRIAMVLGRRDELEGLFQPRLHSVDDILRYESAAERRRVRKESGHGPDR